jgi:transposase-like protein
MSKRRNFSAQFKVRVVLELLSNTKSSAELCREHQLSSQLLGQWKTTFQERAPQLFQERRENEAEVRRIAELEGLVGRLSLENDILKKATSSLPSAAKRNGR